MEHLYAQCERNKSARVDAGHVGGARARACVHYSLEMLKRRAKPQLKRKIGQRDATERCRCSCLSPQREKKLCSFHQAAVSGGVCEYCTRAERGDGSEKAVKGIRLTCQCLTFRDVDSFGFFEIRGVLEAYFCRFCPNL